MKVLPLTRDDLVLVLISDESEAQRVHDVRRTTRTVASNSEL